MAATPLLEQWLDRVEGNPAYLLQNQFALEERRAQQARGGIRGLVETRPW